LNFKTQPINHVNLSTVHNTKTKKTAHVASRFHAPLYRRRPLSATSPNNNA